MSWYDYNNTKCQNCNDKYPMDFLAELSHGEYLMWCKFCGCLLKANKHNPISFSDYKIPKILK
jgi:hypothetical protein